MEINNFCDLKAEEARDVPHLGEADPFFPDQEIGLTWAGEKQHGSPRNAIMMASHANNLQEYIRDKAGWSLQVFHSIDWQGLDNYLGSISAVSQTNAIKMIHNWIHDGYQKDLFAKEGDVHLCPAECGRQEAHQHYISCYVPQMTHAKDKYLRDLNKTWKNQEQPPPSDEH